jgi:hypothetical protein
MYCCANHYEAYQRRELYTTTSGLAKLNAMYILVRQIALRYPGCPRS